MSRAFWARWFPRVVTGETAAAAAAGRPTSFVDDLIEESEQVAHYLRWSGKGADREMWSAIDAIQRSRQADPDLAFDDTVLNLLDLLAERTRSIPFSTLSALKGRWDPANPDRWAKIGTLSLSVIAVALVIATGGLTVIYNRGAAIVGTLSALEPVEVRQNYSGLIREMLQSAQQMNDALTGDSPGPEELSQFDLARNVHYDAQVELSDVSSRLVNAIGAADNFIRAGVWNQIIGRTPAYCYEDEDGRCLSSEDLSSLKVVDGYGPTFLGDCGQIGLPVEEAPRVRQTGSTTGAAGARPNELPRFTRYSDKVDRMAEWLICRQIIGYRPEQLSFVRTFITEMNSILTPMGVMLLPALYGAMGAVLSLMRSALDPLLPQPSIPVAVRRVALGTVAGVIVVWFFTPDSELTGQVGNVGLSLFGLTFLVGFSLDFFFGLIERFQVSSPGGSGRIATGLGPMGRPATAQGNEGGSSAGGTSLGGTGTNDVRRESTSGGEVPGVRTEGEAIRAASDG